MTHKFFHPHHMILLNTYKSFNFCSLNTANLKVMCTLGNILFNDS